MYAQIALPLPLKQLFTYSIPDHFSHLQPGMRVKVPFGNTSHHGVCIEICEKIEDVAFKIKKIREVIDFEPVISSAMMELAEWISSYYQCSLGEILDAMVPAFINSKSTSKTISYLKIAAKEKDVDVYIEELREKFPEQSRVLRLVKDFDGQMTARNIQHKLSVSNSPIKTLLKKNILCEEEKEVDIDPTSHIITGESKPLQLTLEQQKIFGALKPKLQHSFFFPILIHGITGSGKTEIYMKCIEEVIAKGKEAIVLVPEIALTPQTVFRFKQRFTNVAIIHSELTPAQRNHQWQKIMEQKAQVIIGPRSALFSPTKNLGLIVVDEEHEPSFKQNTNPRYNARDVAVKRAQIEKIPVILGSATPSLESYYNASMGKYNLYTLAKRIGKSKLPEVGIVDMKEECRDRKKFVYFSKNLLWALESVIQKKEQAILFLNRRGFATTLTCPGCGYTAKCDNCNIALTYHKKKNIAICHYCNYDYVPPKSCPVCHLPAILYSGVGTQKIEEMLRKIFPATNITRMDSDTMVGRGSYEEVLNDFSERKIDILLGTQMIAKGLDFPHVTLVGIISADTALQIPDFRSAERTFQLVVQVAGRAGRGETPGKVIIQTYHPDHYAIQTALEQDYHAFVQKEMQLRQSTGYPPFGKLLRILIQGIKEQQVVSESHNITKQLRLHPDQGNIQILGPAPAPIDRIKNRYRYHIIVKCHDSQTSMHIAHIIHRILGDCPATLRVSLDVDPLSLM